MGTPVSRIVLCTDLSGNAHQGELRVRCAGDAFHQAVPPDLWTSTDEKCTCRFTRPTRDSAWGPPAPTVRVGNTRARTAKDAKPSGKIWCAHCSQYDIKERMIEVKSSCPELKFAECYHRKCYVARVRELRE